MFPFLAVLLCTMGSLIVLLLIVVQQARVQAETVTETEASSSSADEQEPEDALAEHQKLGQLADRLQQVRSDLRQRLQNSQLDLSHLEDHIRRLRENLQRLEADYHVLQQQEQQQEDAREEKLAQLMQLKAAIDQARRELDEARQQAAARPRSFAIVPYDGPNGTRRRPIYIECRKDQIIIQPEGIVLTPGDFQPPLDAGNPLAAGLRAIREYLTGTGSLRGGEPYPLLLVRPDGAEMYVAARNAMQSWSSEYGYELIDADMRLEFPPADEALADIVRRTVNIARQRSVNLAVRRGLSTGRGRGGSGFGRGGTRSGDTGSGAYLSVSRNGGFQMHGGGDADPWLDRHFGPAGGHASETENGPLAGSPGAAAAHGGDANAADAQGRHAAGRGGRGGFYPPGERSSATSAGGQDRRSATGGLDSGDSAETGAASAAFGPRGEHASGEQTGGELNSAAVGPAGESPAAASSANAGPAGSAAGGAGSSGASANGGGAAMNFTQSVTAMAETRGEDWALPRSSEGATPFTRPIRVECHADRLIVLPDRGSSGSPKVTPLSGPLSRNIDTFVAHLWQHMQGWGIAGPRSYWKPILSVHVAPGGEARYAELAAIMQRSGVDVVWKR